MRTINKLAGLLILCIIMTSFSQCSSAQKIQENAPIAHNQVYFQKWIAGVQGGGSGINIFIPTKDTSVQLDSVYFRGKSTKLELTTQGESMYVGRFFTDFNKRKDMIMSSDSKEEMVNELPEIPQKIPFELNDNECIISYLDGDKTKYFKIDNVVEKETIPYPSAPPNKQ